MDFKKIETEELLGRFSVIQTTGQRCDPPTPHPEALTALGLSSISEEKAIESVAF